MTILEIIILIIQLLTPLALFLGRHFITNYISQSIRYHFDKEIEALKSDFRNSEEDIKSQLRTREGELFALREAILKGTSHRQSLLDARRMDGIERIWAALIALAPYKNVSAMMAMLKLEAIEKETAINPKIKQLFETITKSVPTPQPLDHLADNERPFLSTSTWAYFSAYRAVVIASYMTAKMFESGIKKPSQLIQFDYIQNLLKVSLPHQSAYIDEHKAAGYHFLLEELEQKLLEELKNTMEGVETDKITLERSQAILDMIKKHETPKSG